MSSDKKVASPGRKTTPGPLDTRFTISKFQPEGEFLKHKLTEEDESEDEKTPVHSEEFNFEGKDTVAFRRYKKLDGQCSIEVVETDKKPRKKSIIRQPIEKMSSLEIPNHHSANRRGSVHFAETQDQVIEIPKDDDSNENSDQDDDCSADCEADDEETREDMNSRLSRSYDTLQRKKMVEPKGMMSHGSEHLPQINLPKTEDEMDSSAARRNTRYAMSTFQDKAPFSVPSLDIGSDDESDNDNDNDDESDKHDSESETDNEKLNGLTSGVKRLLRQDKIYGETGLEPATPNSTPYGTPAPHSFLSHP